MIRVSAHTSNELGSEMNWDAMLPTSPTVKSGMTQRKAGSMTNRLQSKTASGQALTTDVQL